MSIYLQTTLLVIAAYLIGGIPMGLLVAKVHGVDIRKHGSGNIGATNVGRHLGRKWGILVLLLDALKGASTSFASGWFVANIAVELGSKPDFAPDLIRLVVAIACVLGNTASPYLGFKGGKGVATALGVLLGIWPFLAWPVLIALPIWAAITLATKLVSLASIVASISVPIAFLVCVYLNKDWSLSERWPLLCLAIALALIVVIRHRSNISRLIAGTETRLGQSDRRPSPENESVASS